MSWPQAPHLHFHPLPPSLLYVVLEEIFLKGGPEAKICWKYIDLMAFRRFLALHFMRLWIWELHEPEH